MGLDMYLYCNDKELVREVQPEGWRQRYGTVMYWRKANMIHNWFLTETEYPPEADDCRPFEVTVNDLENLRDTCAKVLEASRLVDGKVYSHTKLENGKEVKVYENGKVIEDTSVAEELLPTESGFFFGSTEYDEWYYEDVKYTKDALDRLLGLLKPAGSYMIGDHVMKPWSGERSYSDPDWVVRFEYCASW